MQLRPATIAATVLPFLALDAAWLTLMGPRLYQPAIGHLMRLDVDWTAVALFYPVYLAGLLVLAVAPSRSVRAALARGAFFGFVAYATYDLTNQATLRAWPWMVTAVDLCWGSFASAVACAIGAAVALRRR
jgi:uncharacterized membrane protein